MVIIDLEQGSEGWLKWRGSGLGASDAPLLVHGKHFERTLEDLWKEKIQEVIHKKKPPPRKWLNSGAMARGQRLEPLARARYEKLTGIKARPVCGVHEEHEWLKASLDGWVHGPGVVLEIKAPNRNAHQGALEGVVPDYYLPQLDHQLLVSGGKMVHYCSYSDYFEGSEQFALVKYPRNEKKLEEYLKLAREFWDAVLNKRPI